MDEKIFNDIKSRLSSYKLNSIDHIDYSQISNYNVLCNEENCILIHGYNLEMRMDEFQWLANDVNTLLEKINESNKLGIISFIPDEWINIFKENKFEIYAIWNDYFNENISEFCTEDDIETLKQNECKEASEVTILCSNQSRGFKGQSTKWMTDWINQKEPVANQTGARDCSVILHRENDEIVGVSCVGIYGDASPKGSTLWIREIAVNPEFQNKGIGKKLLNKSLYYGVTHGAKRGFLIADECNENALHLYTNSGFNSDTKEYAITMIKN